MSEQGHFHGSDLERIEAAYGIKKESITNYSGNVNPLGLSTTIKTYLPRNIELIASYPDRDYTSLRRTISDYVGTDPDMITVGNGSTELIALCIASVSPKKAVVIGPTYSEYEREIALLGGACIYYPLPQEDGFEVDVASLCALLTEDVDLLVICNPNNPTSTYTPNNKMGEILNHCRDNHIFVMVDETYIEFVTSTPYASCIPLTKEYENLLVIRGVSKFFAAPGLRLGYGVSSHPYYMQKINHAKNPWTINALAAFAGELMMKDTAYIEESRSLIQHERAKIVAVLSKWTSIEIYEPHANFILVKIVNNRMSARKLFETLLMEGLMIRDVSGFPYLDERFFRFCFLKPLENDRLLEALDRLLNN